MWWGGGCGVGVGGGGMGLGIILLKLDNSRCVVGWGWMEEGMGMRWICWCEMVVGGYVVGTRMGRIRLMG